MKKILMALVLVLMLSLVCFVGCDIAVSTETDKSTETRTELKTDIKTETETETETETDTETDTETETKTDTETDTETDVHIHTYGELENFGDNAQKSCDKRLYIRICSECNVAEFVSGTYEDHNFDTHTIAPTCTSEGYDVKTCSICGVSERLNYTEYADHEFSIEVVPPTCTTEGYDIKTCTVCNFSENTNYTSVIDHTFTTKTFAPTCSSEGYDCKTCDECGYSESSNFVDKLEHTWVTNVSHNSYQHWYYCKDCYAKNAVNTHTFVDSTCKVCGYVSDKEILGDWSVYTVKSQYLAEYADMVRSVPGYKYTSEGLSMISVDDEGNSIWMDSSPYATFQTTVPVCIKDGVYLKVRVDRFTYDAGDKWFGFSIWDQQNIEFGRQSEYYGYGVETLIRINAGKNHDKSDKTTWAGAMSALEWYKDLEEGQRIITRNSTNDRNSFNYEFDENGCPIFTLKIEWDDVNEICVVYINEVRAPDAYNEAVTRYFEDLNYMAYIGFSLQNSKTGGTVGCTILEYGTSEDDASAPMGDDFAEPEINTNEVADIADPSTVAEGEPAIILNGVKGKSDVAGKPSSVMGNVITVKEDNSVNIIADINNMTSIKYIVNKDTSYVVEDFPIVLAITRNFCTCNYKDNDGDGVVDAECKCEERLSSLALVGDIKQESSSFSAQSEPLYHEDPFYVGDDFYNYFIFDWGMIGGISGRINGIRLDAFTMKGTDPERNNFDICEIAFFRNMDEAEAYFEAYYDALLAETD